MIRVAVTGGMASGKSAFCRALEQCGAKVADMDKVARTLLDDSVKVKQAVITEFGPKTYQPGPGCNRSTLAKIAFRDEKNILQLENILHPAIRQTRGQLFAQWASQRPAPSLAVAEAALILESSTGEDFDWVILVVAPIIDRLTRLEMRDISEDDARRRMERQWTDDKKRNLAHIVVENPGSLDDLRDKAKKCYQYILGNQPCLPGKTF